MSEGNPGDDLREIRSLRHQGEITPQEAYERHMAVISPPPAAASPAPAVGFAGTAPPIPMTYGRPGVGLHLLAIALALVGGVFGIIGAFFNELQSGGGIFLAFSGAPIIEEAMKPAGIYLLLIRWPQALAGRLHTAMLCALSGVVFGLIESLVYVSLYFPEGDSDYVLFRFTVPVAMHAICSFIVGYGLDRGVFDWAAGRTRLPRHTRNFYIAAVAIHALYNIAAVALELTNVIDFD